MPPKPLTKEKALERLASLCSRSEQCEFEVARKLTAWRISNPDKKEIIDYLKENRFVDDARYAFSFAKDKARFSAWGPYKIKAELVKRHINASLINNALKDIENKIWKESLLKCAVSKAKNLNLLGETGFENRRKLFKYLIGRGFPSASSSKAVALMKKKQEDLL